MLNDSYFELNSDLLDKFNDARSFDKNLKPVYIFIESYLRFVENDNSPYNHLFFTKHPGIEERSLIQEINDVIGSLLDDLIYYKKANEYQAYDEGLVTCYAGISHEYGLFNRYRDSCQAFNYYRISSQLHCPLGTYRLARCYEQSIGTEQDTDKAIYFFRCSAKHGLIEAMHVYGVALTHEYLGCTRDIKSGVHYLSIAALNANPEYPYPLFDMARLYEGKVCATEVIHDTGYAFELYLKGCTFRDPNAAYKLARIYENGGLGKEPDSEKALEYYRKSAKFGQVEGQVRLSEIYFTGIGNNGQRNPGQAYYWACRSGSKGCAKGAYLAGEYSFQGYGVRKDMILAYWWFLISSKFGSEEGKAKKSALYREIHRIDEGMFEQESSCSVSYLVRRFCTY